MRWTNDVYVSTPHRVVSRAPASATRSLSSSIPTRGQGRGDPVLRAGGVAPKYPPILAHDYLRSRFEATYPKAA